MRGLCCVAVVLLLFASLAGAALADAGTISVALDATAVQSILCTPRGCVVVPAPGQGTQLAPAHSDFPGHTAGAHGRQPLRRLLCFTARAGKAAARTASRPLGALRSACR